MSLHDVPPGAGEGMLLAGASPEAVFVRVNQNSRRPWLVVTTKAIGLGWVRRTRP